MSFKYYGLIQIENQNDYDLVNYQQDIVLTTDNFDFSKCRLDGFDVQFQYNNTDISFYRESFSNGSGKFIVKN